ncbi:hypothetical protein FHG66_12815 [Rubellimicrobium rubrum]|uniref:Uncharacterized protein n=1 Tax=Rubellimicrobium rubrum TaxID=2585369 RepID=A0A5C4MUJ4_9RHOB|nr:hypothetical protein [Rubellimicrobium rubrum]TNC49036.1 hypothetical protein FHG66_12815 [Rubellimicrobium rubrum]
MSRRKTKLLSNVAEEMACLARRFSLEHRAAVPLERIAFAETLLARPENPYTLESTSAFWRSLSDENTTLGRIVPGVAFFQEDMGGAIIEYGPVEGNPSARHALAFYADGSVLYGQTMGRSFARWFCVLPTPLVLTSSPSPIWPKTKAAGPFRLKMPVRARWGRLRVMGHGWLAELSPIPDKTDKAGSPEAAALLQALRGQLEAELEALAARLARMPPMTDPRTRERGWTDRRYSFGPFPESSSDAALDYYLRPEVTDEDRHLPHRLWSVPDRRITWLQKLAMGTAEVISHEAGMHRVNIGIYGPGPWHADPSIRLDDGGSDPSYWEGSSPEARRLRERAYEIIGPGALEIAKNFVGTGYINRRYVRSHYSPEPAPIARGWAARESRALSDQERTDAILRHQRECEALRASGPET